MSELSLGDITRQNFDLREQKRELEAQIKEINKVISSNELRIIEKMEDMGVKKIGVDGINIAVTEETQPSVQDWDAVYAYIKENDAFYLLHRRFSAAPYRELLELGTAIPGVEPTVITKVSMKKVATG